MNRRGFASLLTMTLAASALAGCGPAWHVLTQAAPDPFLNQNRFGVLPIDYTGLRVGDKSEPDYLSEKDADQRRSFAEDKVAMNEEYLKAVVGEGHEFNLNIVPATGPGDAPFMIRPVVGWVEPGFYVGVASAPSKVRMVVRITAPDGRILDEIAIDHATSSSLTNPSSGGRLRSDGEALGKITAEYLKSRVAPGT